MVPTSYQQPQLIALNRREAVKKQTRQKTNKLASHGIFCVASPVFYVPSSGVFPLFSLYAHLQSIPPTQPMFYPLDATDERSLTF